MPAEPGQTLSHYQLIEKIGEGGMGVVWKAIDTTLDREVAIKILPDVFSDDPERLARFEREAKLLASLNHANIATIHGFEESAGVRFLVLELVPGMTLAEKLQGGPLPEREALRLGHEIAEGLEAAHAKGVIHRDLKPANVKVTPEGQAKVLDFGLAKAFASDPGDSAPIELSQSPTVTSAGTMAGIILGTAGYMSPEQARGRLVDKQTDVWSFGCLLYEMLAGRRAFDGETASDVIAKILQREPDWQQIPSSTPAAVRQLLRRCLSRERRDRYHDVADARIEIQEILTDPSGAAAIAATPAAPRSIWLRILPWAIVAVLATWLTTSYWTRTSPGLPTVRFTVVAPEGHELREFSVAPGGRNLAFVAVTPQGTTQLWVRPLDSADVRAIPGTEGAMFPFWSPDGSLIAFFAKGKLKRINPVSDTIQTITDAPNGRGGAWSREGIILFTPEGEDVLYSVPASGGNAERLTAFDPSLERSHRFPHFLPDGRRFVYFALSTDESKHGMYLGSLDSTETTFLMNGLSEVYAPPGYLLFVREMTLLAQRFDAGSLRLTGEAFPLMKGVVSTLPRTGRAAFSVSDNGVLAYRTVEAPDTRLVWFDRTGTELGPLGPPGDHSVPALSADGRRVAFVRRDPPLTGTRDLWMLDVARGTSSRLTTGPVDNSYPVWSADGGSLLFVSRRAILRKQPAGSDVVETLLPTATPGDETGPTYPGRIAVSADGTFIVFANWDSTTDWDLWSLRLDGDRTPQIVVRAPMEQQHAVISPDGRWIAYESNESGSFEIYVRRLAQSGGKWMVSTSGGSAPRWQADGSELFYVAPDRTLMAVQIHAGSSFDAGLPTALFEVPRGDASDYLVTPDGNRFVFNVPVGAVTPPAITVVLNWAGELQD